MGTKNLNSATDLITFSRASGGTALRKISYGSELVTNGTFDNGTTGWTATACSVSVVNGAMRITDTDGSIGYVDYRPTLEIGKAYLISAQVVTDNMSGNMILNVGTSGGSGQMGTLAMPSVGTYSFTFTATTSQPFVNLRNTSAGAGDYWDVDNISVKEVLYDQPDGTLQLFNSPDNTPRIEYNPDGTVKGLLIEEARTNLQPDNNSLEIKSVTNLTTTANATTAPDGTNTAVKLAINAGETSSPRLLVGSGQNNPSNVSSIFAKAGEGSFNKIGLGAYNGGGYTAIAYFDLTTGTFDYIHRTSNRNISDYGIEPVGNGWYRIWIKPLNDSGTGFVFVVSDDSTSASSATAGNGSDGLYIWGHQVEAGAFPTSYIPTTGSTATRAADLASIPTANFGYNSDAGSIVAEVLHFTTESGAAASGFAFDDGSANNRMYYYQNKGQWIGSVSGSTTFNIDTADPLENSDTKVGTGYKKDNVSLVVNSSIIGNDTSTDIPSVNKFYFGSTSVGTYLNGHIKSIKYYPRRLSDTQLQELTT